MPKTGFHKPFRKRFTGKRLEYYRKWPFSRTRSYWPSGKRTGFETQRSRVWIFQQLIFFFLRVGFRFLFNMYVFENVCSFVFSFFILTFEQCLKLWQKRNCNAKQNSLRWNAENKILIKERFSKFNCFISEKNAQDQLFLYTDDNIAIFWNCIYMQVFYISHFLEFQNLHTEH